jgi:hypothetical protein
MRTHHTALALVALFVASFVGPSASFTVHHNSFSRQSQLAVFEDYQRWIGGGRTETETSNDSVESLHKLLAKRKDELRRGIGKRYVVRTQKGFLNVHRTFGGPYRTDNIVRQLVAGDVVTSIDRIQDWIKHDAGGWSIAKFGGFVWLEPIDE